MTNNELLSASLLDILFDGRNKDYGAYRLRMEYNRRLLISLGAGLSLILIFIGFSAFKNGGTGNDRLRPKDDERGIIVRTIVDPPPKPDQPIPPKPAKSLPAPPVATVEYRPIKIVPNEEVTDPVKSKEEMEGRQVSDHDSEGPEYNTIVTPPAPAPEGNGSEQVAVAAPAPAPLTRAYPEYPGGYEALLRFLSKNLQTPEDLEAGEKKMVKARFKVDIDGTVSLVEIEQSGGQFFDKEVIRVCKKMPKWKPAVQNGVPVPVSYVLPVTFIGVEQ